MRVVHISTTDYGGAFKAVQRIQESMRQQGIQSDILVRSRSSETDTIEVVHTLWQKLISKGKNFLNLLCSHGEVVTDLFGSDLSSHPKVQEADIIMLHWVNSFISNRSVRLLAKLNKPILWVMHDMWIFTGGCHCDAYCGRYREGCGCCPYLGGRWKRDISYWNLKRKSRLFEHVKITFVAISRWQKESALNSVPLRGKSVSWIPDPLNFDIFQPLDREKIRREHNIGNKKVILFGADKALENPMKGFRYLMDALKQLDVEEYFVICFGGAPQKKRIMPEYINIKYLGTIQDEKELVMWYNIADVFVSPSIQEGFGYTVCEALACGTPVTAFASSGILDQIAHKENGYLAKLYDVTDLAEGIRFCVDNRENLGTAARKRVTSFNSYDIVGGKYRKICQNVLEG